MKLIIDIPKEVYKDIMIHNREMRESGKSAYYFEGLIQNGTPIPDNTTNSDIMLTMFPDETDLHTFARHNKVAWWNAPYQKGEQ